MVKCWERSLGTLPKTSAFISDLSSVKYSLGLTVTLGNMVCTSLKRLREGHGLSVSSSLQKIKFRGKKPGLCSLQRSPVCSLVQESLCTFRNQLSFMKEKNNNDLYSDHLPKKLLYMEQNVCNTFLPFAPFESYPAARFSNSSTSAVPIIPNCCLSPPYFSPHWFPH